MNALKAAAVWGASVLRRMVAIVSGWGALERPSSTGVPPYCVEHVGDIPDAPEDRILYVVGEGVHEWYAVMQCPCGCGEALVMSLLPNARPRWKVSDNGHGTATLSPSVNRFVGCRSHFFLRDGLIVWCEQREVSGQPGGLASL